MSAYDLRKQINDLVYDIVWGEYRPKLITMLRNNLPTSSGTAGNGVTGFYPPGVSLAGKDLYAKGDLRGSYIVVADSQWSPGAHGTQKVMTLTTNSPYAWYYANGRRDSLTYHGFDYIQKTIDDFNAL